MKALKFIGGILLVILVLAAVATLVLPTTTKVHSETIIKAPPEAVWSKISSLKAMDEWGPWKEEDPSMENTFTGEGNAVGDKSEWTGDKTEGSQVVTEIIPMEKFATSLDFKKRGTAEAAFTMEQTEEGVKVNWDIDAHMGRPMNLIGRLMGMKKKMTSSFDKGLANLKELVESGAATPDPAVSNKTVKMEDWPAQTYIGKRSVLAMDDMQAHFGASLPASYGAASQNGLNPTLPSGLYYKWDPENKETDLLAGVKVDVGSEIPEGFDGHSWEAGKCYVIDYYGGYMDMEASHTLLYEKLTAEGHELNGPVVEHYITDPMSEPDTAKWHTRIIYPIK